MKNFRQFSSHHFPRYKYRTSTLILLLSFPQYLWAQSRETGEAMNFMSQLELLKDYLPLLFVPLLLLVIKNNSYRARFVWNKIIGSSFEVDDEKLKEIIQDQLDLEHLRSTAKFKFKNIYHARAIIHWCNKLKIGLDDVAGLSNSIIYDEHPPLRNRRASASVVDSCVSLLRF